MKYRIHSSLAIEAAEAMIKGMEADVAMEVKYGFTCASRKRELAKAKAALTLLKLHAENRATVKLSSKDEELLQYVARVVEERK